MKNCPYCDGWINDEDQSISLVETHVNNFENSQAAECDHCGLRAMSANIEDGDEQAFTFWDNLVDSINNTAAELERYETARQEDARRLEQVKGERDAMREALQIRLQKIVSDDRINYPPANVMINAPLALIQVNLDTEKDVLEWAISLMDAAR